MQKQEAERNRQMNYEITCELAQSHNPNGGPNTPEGKETSARNAIKHGGCSMATLILPNESIDDFNALDKHYCDAYKPNNEHEADLIRAAVRADWFFLRSERNYARVEEESYRQEPDPFSWPMATHDRQKLFLRYRTTHANLLAKARKAIEDFRKNRAHEERHTLHQIKHKPQPTIAELRDKAVREGYLSSDGQPTGKPRPY